LSLTPEDIQGKRFHDAFRGYNHEEVDNFLDRVASSFVAVSGELQTVRRQVVDLEGHLDEVRQTEMMLKRTLLAAQRAADEALAEAKAEAEQTLTSAGQKAAETLASANEKATAAAAGATQKAAETIAGATYRAGEIVAEAHERLRRMEELTERLRGFDVEHRKRLRDFLETQLRALTALPSLPVAAPDIEVPVPRAPVPEGPRPVPDDAKGDPQAPPLAPERAVVDAPSAPEPAVDTPAADAADAPEPEPSAPPGAGPASPFRPSSSLPRQGAGDSVSPWSRGAEAVPPPEKRTEAATGKPEGPPVRSAPGGTHPPGRRVASAKPAFLDVQEVVEDRDEAPDEAESSGPSVRELFWGKG